MPSTKESLMRSKHRVLALAATSLAVFALGGVGASSALAEEPTNTCGGATLIEGQGSSLQKIAQEKVWIPAFEAGVCTTVKVKYTASGSAAGLEAYGVKNLTPVLTDANAYIGTDDAPNATQIVEMEKNLGAPVLVVPVAQASIAIIVKPPTNCEITKIPNADLQEVWKGSLKLWSEISTAKPKTVGGTECEVEITRVVREDGSGTTYQFKHYLDTINSALLPGTKKKGTLAEERNWEELQPETEPNTEWPESEGAVVLTPVVKPTLKGGHEEVEKVKATADSIGYANLGDAREVFEAAKEKEMYWVEVQKNGVGGTPTYAKAGTSATEPGATAANANCAATEYSPIPTNAEEPNQDWSKVYGGKTSVGTGHYPICTLTWDVALTNYETAKYTAAASVGQSTYDYISYITETDGGQQEISNKHDYLELTASVQEIAELVAKQIGGGTRLLSGVKEVAFGVAGEKHLFIFTNDGPKLTEPLATGIKIDGANAANYVIIKNTCVAKDIVSGGTCEVEVEFLGGTKDAKLLLAPGQSVLLN
jgi:ABC-type phosphate transport system substrate-binding protein